MTGKAALLLALALGVLHAAPAPRPREKPLALAGQWTLVWGSVKYAMDLRKDGTCSERGQATAWAGCWRLEGRTLTVCDRPDDWPDDPETAWSVTLDDSLSGAATYGTQRVPVRLEAPAEGGKI